MSNANDAEFHELEPLPEDAGGPSAPPEPAAQPKPAKPASAGASGPIELEQAPILLQKAALILGVASLLPWFNPVGFDLRILISKAVILLGGWVAYCAVEHSIGVKTPLDALGAKHKLALPILAQVIMLFGVAPIIDQGFRPVVEKGALYVGTLAWCQLHAYAKTGKYNPLLALMMPLFGLGGLAMAIVAAISDIDGAAKGLAILGSLGVTGAGGFAGYTLVLAMKEAKAHGEAKKRSAMEARMAERKAKRGDAGAAPKA